MSSPALAMIETNPTIRADGSAIEWHLEVPPGSGPYPLLVFMQGSGCEPAMAGANYALVEEAFAGHAILAVEKPGVDADDTPDATSANADCSDQFFASATVSQRILDYETVLGALSSQDWWNGHLVLFGGSEGGLVAGTLAGKIHADLSILISTGGGLPFGEALKLSIPEVGWPSVEAQFARIRANPESLERWAGYSYTFWADMLDRSIIEPMIAADTKFLLIQGGRDPSSPPVVARSVADAFAAASHCHLTYWELAGLDHSMSDTNARSHMSEIVPRAANWAASQSEYTGCSF